MTLSLLLLLLECQSDIIMCVLLLYRRPKDILCLILFVAFIIGMLSIGVYGMYVCSVSLVQLIMPIVTTCES